jgi:hypothetical protein
VKNTLNTPRPLKDHNEIIQAIEYFNATIQQAACNSISSSDTKEHHTSTSITIREKIKGKHNLRKHW